VIRATDIKGIIRKTVTEAPLDWSAVDLCHELEAKVDELFAASERWTAFHDKVAQSKGLRAWKVIDKISQKFHVASRTGKPITYEFKASADKVAERLNNEGL
jgi:hypothetical protein